MSVNISVTGNTLKDCHDQIIALAKELKQIPGAPEVGATTDKAPSNVTQFPVRPGSPSFDLDKGHSESVDDRVSGPTTAPTYEDRDSTGLPWDGRIHANPPKFSKDGTWKRRRGVNAEAAKTVEDVLRAEQAKGKNSVPPFGSMTPEQYQAHTNPSQSFGSAPTPEAPLTQVKATPQFNVPQQPVNNQELVHNLESFRANLASVIETLCAKGTINKAWIDQNKNMFGGKDVWQWHEEPVTVAALFDFFVAQGYVLKV